MEALNISRVAHRFVEVDGVRIFYREAGPPDAPTMLLLHGFPSASHQYRRLIDALGGRYRLIAPDYPGFGHSDAPEPTTTGGTFAYTFDRLADVVEGFCERLGLDRFVMYVFDWGAPVGFRIATRHPEWIAGLVVQNGNAYNEHPVGGGARVHRPRSRRGWRRGEGPRVAHAGRHPGTVRRRHNRTRPDLARRLDARPAFPGRGHGTQTGFLYGKPYAVNQRGREGRVNLARLALSTRRA
jgi:pimeloyl-ACP methyl ester carboxylesterase